MKADINNKSLLRHVSPDLLVKKFNLFTFIINLLKKSSIKKRVPALTEPIYETFLNLNASFKFKFKVNA